MGGICSVVTVSLAVLLCSLKAIEHFWRFDVSNEMTLTIDDGDMAFDLFLDGNYQFAIRKIDERFGSLRIKQVTRFFNETLQKRDRIEVDVELVSCKDPSLFENGVEESIFGI